MVPGAAGAAVNHGEQPGGGAQHDALVHDAIFEAQVLVLDQPGAKPETATVATQARTRALPACRRCVTAVCTSLVSAECGDIRPTGSVGQRHIRMHTAHAGIDTVNDAHEGHLSSSMFSSMPSSRPLARSRASRHAMPTAAEELMPLLSRRSGAISTADMPFCSLRHTG